MGEQGEDEASNPGIVIQTVNEYAITGCNALAEDLGGVIDPQLTLLSRIDR